MERPVHGRTSLSLVCVGNDLTPRARFVVPKGRVPDLDLTVTGVAASRGEALTVGAERQAPDKAGMAAQRDRLRRRGRLQVPDLDGRVPTPGGQVAAVRAEGHLPDVIHMALQRAQF